jgi:hypothetical protein
MVRRYHLVEGAQGSFCLCLPATIWPALSGMLSDRLWEFEVEAQPLVEELVIMGNRCCEVFEECGLLTLEELLALVGSGPLGLYPMLPPEPPEGGHEFWPPPGLATEEDCCAMAYAIYQAVAFSYDQAYDLAHFGLESFASLCAPLLEAMPYLAIGALVASLVAAGVYELLQIAIETNRHDTVCDMVVLCDAGSDDGIEAMRDFCMDAFKSFSPVGLGFLRDAILPLARRMFLPGIDCACAAEFVCRPGGGPEDPYEHPEFTYLAGHVYRVEHVIGQCRKRIGEEVYRSICNDVRPPAGYFTDSSRGGNYGSYSSCEDIDGNPPWYVFTVTTETSLMKHADTSTDWESLARCCLIEDLGEA